MVSSLSALAFLASLLWNCCKYSVKSAPEEAPVKMLSLPPAIGLESFLLICSESLRMFNWSSSSFCKMEEKLCLACNILTLFGETSKKLFLIGDKELLFLKHGGVMGGGGGGDKNGDDGDKDGKSSSICRGLFDLHNFGLLMEEMAFSEKSNLVFENDLDPCLRPGRETHGSFLLKFRFSKSDIFIQGSDGT